MGESESMLCELTASFSVISRLTGGMATCVSIGFGVACSDAIARAIK